MQDFTVDNLTEDAIRRLQRAPNARLKQVVEALTRHLHAFILEVRPTEEEWMLGIKFLTETGQTCDDVRQEFILLSDTLGVSMLVDALNHQAGGKSTESSVLGPFYREGAPHYANGQSMSQDGVGEPVVVSGRVLDPAGKPVAGARLDVWQTAPNGLYEVQDDNQPDYNLRGVYTADADGRFAVRTVKPVSYPIPDDGPVGKLLRALGRHPYRPAHIHFIVSAKGYAPVVTQLFTDDDTYLESDAVFGVKKSLVVHYDRAGNGWQVAYDFRLKPA